MLYSIIYRKPVYGFQYYETCTGGIIILPRGRKKTEVAPQDLLNEVLTSIEETEQKLKTLKAQKKDIEKQIEAKEMAELYAIVKEKNMSIEDVKTKLGAE